MEDKLMNEKDKDQVIVVSKIFRNEDTISRSIESVLNQTHKNFKYYILCGAQTVDTIQKYASQDDRIIVYYTEHMNEGYYECLEEVKRSGGRWFTWIDGDDWYELDFMENSINFAKERDLDLVIGGYNIIGEEGQIEEKRYIKKSFDCKVTETDKWFIEGWAYLSASWGILFNLNMLNNFGVNSRPAAETYGGRGSDTMFNYAILPEAKKIGFLNECVYNYQKTITSHSYAVNPNRKFSSKIVLDFVLGSLLKLGNSSFVNIYYLYTQFGCMVMENINLVLNSNLPIEEKYCDIKFLLSQEDIYKLYNYTIITRRDQFQNIYMNLIFGYKRIFSDSQLFELLQLIYPGIGNKIKLDDVNYDNYNYIISVKNALVENILRETGR